MPSTRRSSHARTATLERDEARGETLARELARLAGAGAFAFVRYDDEGTEVDVAVDETVADPARFADWLKAERLLQNRPGAPLPRVLRSILPVAPYSDALTVVFGRDDSLFAIVLLLREPAREAFSGEEIALVEGALASTHDRLLRIRGLDGEQPPIARAAQRSQPAYFVLDLDYRVEYSWTPREAARQPVLRAAFPRDGRFPPLVESAVRALASQWDEPAIEEGVPPAAIPLPSVIVRAFPLAGGDRFRIGVTLERFRSRNTIRWAARRFAMSAREVEILGLVLQGYGTPEIAARLRIAESTAHDHVKRMLLKTKSRNRVEMAAKALGWRPS